MNEKQIAPLCSVHFPNHFVSDNIKHSLDKTSGEEDKTLITALSLFILDNTMSCLI